MIDLYLIDGPGVLYARCAPPFAMNDILDLSRRLASGAVPGVTLSSPAIFDARAISFDAIETEEIRSYMRQRTALSSRKSESPLAMVAGDPGSFGMLRMMGIVAEISGIRDEDRTLVTYDLDDAIAWIADQVQGDPGFCSALSKGIADQVPDVLRPDQVRG